MYMENVTSFFPTALGHEQLLWFPLVILMGYTLGVYMLLEFMLGIHVGCLYVNWFNVGDTFRVFTCYLDSCWGYMLGAISWVFTCYWDSCWGYTLVVFLLLGLILGVYMLLGFMLGMHVGDSCWGYKLGVYMLLGFM